MIRSAIGLVLALLLPTAEGAPAHAQSPPPAEDPLSLLVFTKTNGYRHASIPDGRAMFDTLATRHGWRVQATEDSTAFRSERLAGVDVVVFLSTTGNVLGPEGEAALRQFVQQGGGFVGIHAASDTEYDWPWYGRLVGAYFDGHPPVQTATVRVEDRAHSSTRMLPATWARRDEWYDFRMNPRDSVRVLATLDESTYEGGSMGGDHPIVWCRTIEGGRAWYTAGGHTTASFRDTLFREHVAGGVRWAAERAGK
jgi:type 1 glutamine amidotransferase